MLLILSSLMVKIALASGLTCQTGKIRYYEFGKQIIENSNYCFDGDHTELRSKNCQTGTCAALAVDVLSEEKLESSAVGNPSFAFCRRRGGDPKIIEFQAQGTWYSLDRCYFEKDKSFVDCGSLFSKWLHDKK